MTLNFWQSGSLASLKKKRLGTKYLKFYVKYTRYIKDEVAIELEKNLKG